MPFLAADYFIVNSKNVHIDCNRLRADSICKLKEHQHNVSPKVHAMFHSVWVFLCSKRFEKKAKTLALLVDVNSSQEKSTIKSAFGK